jgi:molecular chaperone GrpE (heat shock protein)
VSPDSHAWVVELSNEQAKEIADLSQQLDISQREYLRVSALYQDMKKENEKLQKSLKKYQGNH